MKKWSQNMLLVSLHDNLIGNTLNSNYLKLLKEKNKEKLDKTLFINFHTLYFRCTLKTC